MAPDGVEKQMLVYNNQFPGPLIEANWGDTLVVHVQNNLQDNGYASVLIC
jgi:FtsP/CotA-like multicopper oxidase with cupredoxin domain